MQTKANRQALKLTLIYILVAGGWILFSGKLLVLLVHNPNVRDNIEVYKGFAFVLVTGGLLYMTVRRLLRNWEREAEQRREIMDKLRASEERYQALFERSLDCVFLSDFDGNFLDANQASLDLFGYQREDIATLTFAMLLTEDQLPLAFQTTEEIRTTGQQKQPVEFHLRGKDGREVHVEIRASLIYHDGKPFAILGIARDHTQRKQVEKALRESQEHFRQLAETITDVFWLASPDFQQMHYVSPGYERVWGRTAASLYAHPHQWIACVLAEDRERVAAAFGSLRAEASEVSLEYRIARPDGSVRWVLDRGFQVRDAAGNLIRLSGTATDITGRKQAEAALQLSDFSVNQASLPTFWIARDSRIIRVNRAACVQLGYTEAELLQLAITDLDPDFPPERWPRAWQELRTLKRQCFETCHRHKDGHLIPVEVELNWLEFDGVDYSFAFARDISERKQAMNRLTEMRGQLVEAQRISRLGSYVLNVRTGRWISSEVLDELFGIVDSGFTKDIAGWLQTVHPAERADMQRYLQDEVLTGRALFDRTYRIVRQQDQQERWVHGLGKLVLDEHSRVVQMMGTIQDITERKHAELALQESEEKYRNLFESSRDAIMTLDPVTGRFTSGNPATLEIFAAKNQAEFFTRSPMDLSPERQPDGCLSAEKARTMIDTAMREGSHFFEWTHRRINGGEFFTDVMLTRMEQGGKPVVMATVRDITERKQAERRIVEATNYAQTLLAASPIGIITYRADGQTISANEAAARLVGTTLENVRKQNFRELESWKESKLLERAELALTTGQEQLFENLTVSSYGNRSWLSIRFVPFHYEGNPHLLLLAQDITERNLAEEQVRLQLSALTAAANAILITDGNGKIEWVNPAFTKLTGYSAQEAIGCNPRLLKSGRHPPGFYANLWATIVTGNVWHGEIINKRKDGRFYTEELTITPVRGADGTFAHFVAIKQDVTEREELQRRLQQAQKMEAIGTLAGGIAHDFNNILAAMIGYSFLLNQDTRGNPSAQEHVAEILKTANRAKDLVQQILTFSHQREFHRQVIRLDTVVKEALKFLRASMPANIKIETSFAPAAPAALADPTQIYQVVINLATNALHAMGNQPGQLTVSLEPFQPDDAFLGLHPEFKPIPYTRLTVADTGHGMDAGTLERIFEPFFTTKPVGIGTGLGLSVVHGIIQAHEGAITVESKAGRGTTFALFFPGQSNDTTLREAGAKNAPGGRGQTILLLDDEPTLTAMLQSLLERLNYRVTTSNRAREAIGLCLENPARFDLVITDLTMPEVNGFEVARQIRAIRPDMPVILTSGFSVELNREDLMAAGFSELLMKPVGLNQFAEAVQRALIKDGRRLPPAHQPL